MTTLPILYSFRRCPYAMRARMTVAVSGVKVELREVVLRDKPPELIAASAKATVPVVVLPGGKVIDESLDIMRWALGQNDPDKWLARCDPALIEQNDGAFKSALDRYKYPHRYDLPDGLEYRAQGLNWLMSLDGRLMPDQYIDGPDMGLTDTAIFPFVRQFAATDREWFDQQSVPNVHHWLAKLSGSSLFSSVMTRYPQWRAGNDVASFPL